MRRMFRRVCARVHRGASGVDGVETTCTVDTSKSVFEESPPVHMGSLVRVISVIERNPFQVLVGVELVKPGRGIESPGSLFSLAWMDWNPSNPVSLSNLNPDPSGYDWA